MTAPLDLDQVVTAWLQNEASASGSDRVLAAALGRVSAVRQERRRPTWLQLPTGPTMKVGVVAVTAVVLAVASVGLLARSPDVGPGSDIGATRKAPDATFTGVPAENGLIAYVWRGDLYVGDPASGRTTAIVTGPETVGGPRFSPNGTHVAFYRWDSTGGVSAEIVVARADGSDPRVVVPRDATGGPGPFAWTPDSGSLVVAHDIVERASSAPTPPVDFALSIIDVSGVAEPRLLTPPLPRWPDRQWMDPMAAMAQMFRPPSGDMIVASDDDALTVFDADRNTISEFRPEALADLRPYWVRWPGWSPDGSMLIFSLDRGEFGWFEGQLGSFVMNADGTGVRRIGPANLSATSVWSPDGSRIAFEVLQDGDAEIVIVDAASGAQRRLDATLVGTTGAGPIPVGWSWSPDGRSIVFLGHEGDRPIIVDSTTGEALGLPWESDSAPSWQRAPRD